MNRPGFWKVVIGWMLVILSAVTLVGVVLDIFVFSPGVIVMLLIGVALLHSWHKQQRAFEERNEMYKRQIAEIERKQRALQAEADAIDARYRAVKEQEAAKRQSEPAHWNLQFNVAGVTFENADGSSRQEIIEDFRRRFVAGKLDDARLELEDYKYKGELAYRVVINGRCVGNVPKNRIAQVRELLEHGIADAETTFGAFDKYADEREVDDEDYDEDYDEEDWIYTVTIKLRGK